MTTEMVPAQSAGSRPVSLAPRSFEEAVRFAELVAVSSFAPAAFKGKPGDILIAVQMGAEVGLHPLQAIQNIAVINGKPCMYGDALLGCVQASGLLESINETGDEKHAVCTVKRKGDPNPKSSEFTMEDAKRAGLVGKQGPWQTYPKRMLQMRARGFALRDGFADVLKGLITREEAEDMPVKTVQIHVREAEIMPKERAASIPPAPQDVPLVIAEAVQPVAEETIPPPPAEAKPAPAKSVQDIPVTKAFNGKPEDGERMLTEEESKRIFVAAKKAGGGWADIIKPIINEMGYKHTSKIPLKALDAVLAEIEGLGGGQ
jgi:hypothetical protein